MNPMSYKMMMNVILATMELKTQCLKNTQNVAFTNFCSIKVNLSCSIVWLQVSGFQNSPKLITFGIFNQLLSTQNVNVARFARNVKWDFFCDFQTPCQETKISNFFFGFERSESSQGQAKNPKICTFDWIINFGAHWALHRARLTSNQIALEN